MCENHPNPKDLKELDRSTDLVVAIVSAVILGLAVSSALVFMAIELLWSQTGKL